MNTPVMTASGTFGFGEEFADFTNLEELGAVVVKGTTLQPRRGNNGVRIALQESVIDNVFVNVTDLD